MKRTKHVSFNLLLWSAPGACYFKPAAWAGLERHFADMWLHTVWRHQCQVCNHGDQKEILSREPSCSALCTNGEWSKLDLFHQCHRWQWFCSFSQVLESCVKNCGSLIHEEIATRAFMEELRELLKHTNDESTKKKILEMLQTWGMAFRNSPRYRIATVSDNLVLASFLFVLRYCCSMHIACESSFNKVLYW